MIPYLRYLPPAKAGHGAGHGDRNKCDDVRKLGMGLKVEIGIGHRERR